MNEILGLLDSLEATILEGKKIPFTDNIILDEKKILTLTDKLRLGLKNDSIIKKTIDQSQSNLLNSQEISPKPINTSLSEAEKASQIITQAQNKADSLLADAKNYTNQILAQLQLMVTKMQKNLITMEKSIEGGRAILDKSIQTNDKQRREGKIETPR